jgi:hypothetical protein
VVFIGIYLYCDPFMVLRKYSRYDMSDVYLSESMVGWRVYQQEKNTRHVNSFVMGNSCTQAFKCRQWQKYLGSDAVCMRFFDNGETIGGIEQKLQALDRDGASIKNVLMITDWDTFDNVQPHSGILHSMPPEADPTESYFQYQLRYIQKYLYPDFLFPFIWHLCDSNHCTTGVIHNFGRIRDFITNDAINPKDKTIAKEGLSYWTIRKNLFPMRRERIAHSVINFQVIKELADIRSICFRHHTKLEIVIGPNYKMARINPTDLKLLNIIFGSSSVHDYSGFNNLSGRVQNYYDVGHYRPLVGEEIMKEIYSSH